jgi:putative nucleotidyltransferase with HDIG domain
MSQTAVFVDAKQIDKFYEYSAEKLARLSTQGIPGVSETERAERLKQNVQQLFHNVLDASANADFDTGKDLLEQSNKVVQKFVESKTKINIIDQIKNVLNNGSDSYSHAQAVSTLACLLSMALEIGQPEDLAIAGLFHDIGHSNLTQEIDPFNYQSLPQEELEKFKKHPLSAVVILKEKRITLTPKIAEIIEKHHERMDGKGFPAQLPPHKIPMEAQLLSFANHFEYLMRQRAGQKAMSPLEAVDKIAESAGLSHELIAKVRKFFAAQQSPQIAKGA